MESIPYDVFDNLINTGNISGMDLIHLCNSSVSMNIKCNARNGALFKQLLLRDYNITSETPRETYVMITKIQGYTLGSNRFGELGRYPSDDTEIKTDANGNNSYVYPLVPKPILGIHAVKQICGGSHTNEFTAVLDYKGQLWTVGGLYDTYSMPNASLEDQARLSQPILREFDVKFSSIGIGGNRIFLLDLKGRLWQYEFKRDSGFFPDDYFINGESPDGIFKRVLGFENFRGIKQISYSTYTGAILDANNNVWSHKFQNRGGHLFLIQGLRNIVKIAAGRTLLALDTNQKVWSWAEDDFDQGDTVGRDGRFNIPQIIPTIDKAIDICSGLFHSVIIDERGNAWSFGVTEGGGLGLGYFVEDDVYSSDYEQYNSVFYPRMIKSLKNITKVACGANVTVFLDNKGEIYWTGRLGGVENYRLKKLDNVSGAIDVFAGDSIIAFTK